MFLPSWERSALNYIINSLSTFSMSQEKPKLVTPGGATLDVVLALCVFAVFAVYILPSHVPFYHPVAKYLVSAYGATVMGGFTWIALSLFRVTRVDQKLRKQQREAEAKSAQ